MASAADAGQGLPPAEGSGCSRGARDTDRTSCMLCFWGTPGCRGNYREQGTRGGGRQLTLLPARLGAAMPMVMVGLGQGGPSRVLGVLTPTGAALRVRVLGRDLDDRASAALGGSKRHL